MSDFFFNLKMEGSFKLTFCIIVLPRYEALELITTKLLINV